ncbi:MAG: hypothetical protein IKK33_10680 [Lachnospiraceae bacterium]|nr:hypothetical protein [Lachnospiraceae bacterium]
MEHKLLVLCDPEEDYALHMADFLRRKKDMDWDVRIFTVLAELQRFCQEEVIEILLVAETAYGEHIKELPVKLPILLNESGILREKNLENIDKYQPAEQVWQEMLALYMEKNGERYPKVGGRKRGKLIGLYSPVRRCLQSTFALTMGQLIAEKYPVLYVSFEYFAGLEEWQDRDGQDLSVLLYYQQNRPDTFGVQLQALVKKVGKLDYVTPMLNGENLLYITQEQWKSLIQALLNTGDYEYIILDLSESIQGLFEILHLCHKVYTIVREDSKAYQKIYRYEQLLSLLEYEDIKEKTAKCHLPLFRKLPGEVESFTKGELAEYIMELLKKEGIL